MKKLNIVLMSILTIVLSSVLAACSFKKAEASFSQDELIVSLEAEINLDDYLEVSGIDKKNVSYLFSNSSMFSVEGNNAKAISSGKSYVYATYQNNSLDSMQIVVRKGFEAPSQFTLDKNGVFSWNAVSSYFENESTPTKPDSYLVQGTYVVYSSQNPMDIEETKTINQVVYTNSYQLTDAGVYNLTVKAQATGYFDASVASTEQTLYFGYMDTLGADDLVWDSSTANLSWSAVSGAKYKVNLDGILLGDYQTTTSKDLSQELEKANAGVHTLSVVVYDAEGKKIEKQSEIITINKLALPVAEYKFSTAEGGLIEITPDSNVEKYKLILSNGSQNLTPIILKNEGEKLVSVLKDIPSGVYDLDIVAMNESGNFYQSSVLSFGKIYKMPTLTFEGLGENALNGQTFNAKVSGIESLLDTTLFVDDVNSTIDGCLQGENSKEFEITLVNARAYNLAVVNMPKTRINTVGDETVLAINSDLSNSLNVVKVGEFAQTGAEIVVHKYNQGTSVFEFEKVDNATDYVLSRNDGTAFVLADEKEYSWSLEEDKVIVRFAGEIEDLFETVEGSFEFRIIAKTADDTLAINSSTDKTLALLSAPISAESGNSANKTYTWNEVENAGAYRLEIYQIDKDLFEENQDGISIDISSLTKVEEDVQNASFTFENAGYYYARIFAISTDESQYISSLEYLEEVFYIAEKLQNGAVKFGYDENYKNHSGFTASSGYYLQVANAQNIDKYQVSINSAENSMFEITEGDTNIYLLAETFDAEGAEISVSVIGNSNDDRIYLASDPTIIRVERLASVEYEDLQIDNLTTTLTIKEKTGVTGAKIWESDANFASNLNGMPVMDISKKSNFDLEFSLYGTAIVDNLYQDVDGKIYLDSAESTISFTRLQSPTNFKYYNGNLTFDHVSVSGTKYYVLDLICNLANGEKVNLSIRFDRIATAVYGSLQQQFGLASEFVSYSGNTVTITLSKIIELLKVSDEISSIYNQAVDIEFAVYAYQNLNDAAGVTLSSYYATLFADSSKTKLKVEKMTSTKLTFEATDTDFVISWDEVTADSAVSAETTYQIYLDDVAYGNKLSSVLTYSFSSLDFEVSTLYTLYVTAQNPYYLGENRSNQVKIYKLASLKQLTLTDEGKLSYEISTAEKDFVDYVQVTTTAGSVQNTIGLIDISTDGKYAIVVVGKTVESSDVTYYYINSDETSWTLSKMENLKPNDSEVAFENNLISWNAFGSGAGIESLEYIAIFKDENDATASYKTTETSINLETNTQLYESIASLSAGNIQIGISAHFGSYKVAAGGTVYYSQNNTLLNGNTEANHYLYTCDSPIKKLTTPEVTSVDFEYDGLENAQFPDIIVEFTGNYGDTGRFSIFINDNDVPVLTTDIEVNDGKYSFTLTKENYNNGIDLGQTMTIKIKALSTGDIPSAMGSVDVIRVVEIENIEFESQNQIIGHNLVFTFDEEYLNYTVGGIVVQVDYQENGADAKTELFEVEVGSLSKTLTYDMSSFIETNLFNGGTLSISAYINNYADDENKIYYLAPPTMSEIVTYDVLRSVETVSRQTGGFVVDKLLNNETTVYIVEYGASRFEAQADDFYFEFPNDWENNSYELTIYAIEEGYVSSAANKITFALNRIDKIDSVTMQRDEEDLSKVNLSWEEISGATGYILRMYAKDDADRANMLYEFNTIDYHTNTATTPTRINGMIAYSLTEIFGANYQSLIEYGQVGLFDLMSNYDVVFDIVTIGGTDNNNSQAFSFNATIKGNIIQVTDIRVDNFGRLTFVSETGKTYLYRFLQADGTEVQTWKSIEATSTSTIIEVPEIEVGVLFNVEIIVAGSAVEEPVTSADYVFELDSIPATTFGNDTTFTVNDQIENIGYHEFLPSSLAFYMVPNSFSSVYVGLSKDALMKGDVVSIVPQEAYPAEVEMQYIYSYSFIDLINLFRSEGYQINIADVDTTFYFWSYRQVEFASVIYTISKTYEFNFNFVKETSFVDVLKVGDLGEDSEYTEDYMNTFAVFTNDDIEGSFETLGIYVRITQLTVYEESPEIENGDDGDLEEEIEGEENTLANETDKFSIIKFIAKADMINHAYFQGQSVFVINLTELFEQGELTGLSGTFSVEFSKLQVSITETRVDEETTLVEHKFTLSDWLTGSQEKSFEFERLPSVKALTLSNGNIYWTKNGELATRYYVYFMFDLNGNVLGDDYTYFATTNTYFNASEFANTNYAYYLAVQSASEDPYLLSSRKSFILDVDDGNNEPISIYKNQVNSPLTLKDGKLYIDWKEEGDFYQTLTTTGALAELADTLANKRFVSPFTFTLKDLLNNNVTLRIRFTSINAGAEGIRSIVDVNAKYLLADINKFCEDRGFDLQTHLESLYINAQSMGTKDLIDKFRESLVKNSSDGIANSSILFDDNFEKIQMGQYKIEYCLVGSNTTLSSAWYNFKNVNNENTLFVNEEPEIKAIKVQDERDISKNYYQLLIKKSQIYTYFDGSYEKTVAENYVMKLLNDANASYVFSIYKGIDGYMLSLKDSESQETVSVYETNSSGEVTENGEYLMFYLNFNDGDSLLGIFGKEVAKRTYKMQIYAVGNNYSASSKSEYFSMTLLGFGESFAVNNGEFTWTNTQGNRKTNVIYKKQSSFDENITEIDGSMRYSRFSLEELGSGLYEYIKFVVFGEVRGNTILVDSEIYQIDSVYKLASPTLNNNYGYIGIDDSINKTMLGVVDADDPTLQNCYSDGSIYNYMLYNMNASSYITFADENNANSILYYETGITDIDLNNPDFAYKNTEQNATLFHVASLGTTAAINIAEDEEYYYLRKMYCQDINNNGESSALKVAIRSQFAQLDAAMLDSVQSASIENGVLKWNAVAGRSQEGYTIPTENGAKIVYKVSIVQYKLSNTEEGEVDTNVGEEYFYYTTDTSFDFTLIDENQINNNVDEPTYLKAKIQAMAMNVSDRESEGCFKLVEGGYASGNLKYAGKDSYILMGNGTILRQIDRLPTIDKDSLEVVNGTLYWTLTTSTEITNEEMFFAKYSFVVADENDREIAGTLSVEDILADTTNGKNTFKIKFVENAGAMKSGTQILKVYTSQAATNEDLTIKSFAREIEITKLANITVDDFMITSDAMTETLDMSQYFADGNANIVTATIKIMRDGVELEDIIEFNKNQYKLYILRDFADVGLLTYPMPTGYINGYYVIQKDEIAKISFKVSTQVVGIIFSDISEEFLLQRSSWGDEGKIVWDNESQTFSWKYDGYYTFNTTTVADKVSQANVLIENVVLYNDSSLSEASEITLTSGERVTVREVVDGKAIIMYLGQSYYIRESSVETQQIVEDQVTFAAGDLFKVVGEEDNKILILYEDNKYLVNESAIVQPVYIIEAVYSLDQDDVNQITRIYTTTESTFTPTIVSYKIRLKVRVKLGSTNIQSDELTYLADDGVIDYVRFDLFESGQGTSVSPYIITNETQFRNISKRMQKQEYLTSFVQNNADYTEESQYYFSIQSNMVLSEAGNEGTYLTGVLFDGEFSGVIEGNGSKITYISAGTEKLTQEILVADGNVLGSTTTDKSTTFTYGTALFETLTSTAVINDLDIDVTYTSTTVNQNSLMAGLAISNSGKIDNVNLVGFDNGFVGYRTPNERIMMIYSGIASINTGSSANISNCSVSTDMKVNDTGFSQVIFLSGIVYTNYAVVDNCNVGQGYELYITCQKTTDTIQVAGIAITSLVDLRNCTNNFDITIEGIKAELENLINVYVGGVACYGTGIMMNNANNGAITTINIGSSYLTKGDISAIVR